MTLVAILCVSLLLRLLGSQQGYPEFYGHVDEIGVAASIWGFFRNGSLEPTEFTYPAFYSYLVAVGVWVSAALGIADLPQGGSLVARIAFLSYADPAWSALVGRAISAVAGALAVAVTGAVAGSVSGRGTGLVAALFAAAAVVPVALAHNALPDATAHLFGAAVAYFAWGVYRRGAWRDYALAGITSGLLLATKYNGALCALAIAAAHAQRNAASQGVVGWLRAALTGRRLWVAGALAAAAAVVGSPYLVLAHGKYLAVATYQVSSLGFAQRATSPWWWIADALATQECAVGGMMLAGLGVAVWRRDPFDRIALAAFLPAAAYIGSWTRESLHYLVPYYPFLSVSAARAAVTLGTRLGLPRVARIVAGLAIVGPSLWVDVDLVGDLSRQDTRAVASAWIAANVPDGSALAMTWLPYCPRLQVEAARERILSLYAGQPAWQEELRRRWARAPAYRIVNLEVWLRAPVVPEALVGAVDLDDPEVRRVFSRGWRSLDGLRDVGVGYVVLPEAVYERYRAAPATHEEHPARYRRLVNRAYFESLLSDERLERLVRVTPVGHELRGTAIDIYRLR